MAGHAGDDHLSAQAVLEQRYQIGQGAVVGFDVQLAAPEAGDAVVEHVAAQRPALGRLDGMGEALRLTLGGVAGAPGERRLVASGQPAQLEPVAHDLSDLRREALEVGERDARRERGGTRRDCGAESQGAGRSLKAPATHVAP